MHVYKKLQFKVWPLAVAVFQLARSLISAVYYACHCKSVA